MTSIIGHQARRLMIRKHQQIIISFARKRHFQSAGPDLTNSSSTTHPDENSEHSASPSQPSKKKRNSPFVIRLLLPYESACKVLSDEELKEAIVSFSQQVGVVFTLLASISAGGLFLETLVPTGVAAHAQLAGEAASGAWISSNWTVTAQTQHWLEMLGYTQESMPPPYLPRYAAPCFCASTLFNLFGLVNATNVLGRAQVIPTTSTKDYVRNNSLIVHSTYWALIPAISTFGMGVVCTVDHLYGEPLTTWALAGWALTGLSQARNLVALGQHTEKVTTAHEMKKDKENE